MYEGIFITVACSAQGPGMLNILHNKELFHPSSVTQLLPVQPFSVPWHLISSPLPHSAAASHPSQVSLTWDLQSIDFSSFSLSALSCLHFFHLLLRSILNYHSLARNHISFALLPWHHLPDKTTALTGCLLPDCWVHPDRKNNCYADWHLTLNSGPPTSARLFFIYTVGKRRLYL